MFCVSSKIMITASSGARVTPARRPPIPSSAYPPTGASRPGTARCVSFAIAPPSAAPTRSDGVKTPPTPPDPIVAEVATILPAKIATRNRRRVAAQDPVGSLEPVAPDLRKKDPERADGGAPDRHRDGPRELQPRERRLGRPQGPHEQRRAGAGQQPDQGEGNQLEDGLEPERGDAVDRLIAEDEPHEDRREDGRDDGRAEERHRKGADDHLEHEERRGDRRVVRAGDPGRHAAGRQDPDALGRELQPAREPRGHRRADLDDRALASFRPSRRDDRDRGEHSRDRGTHAHAPPTQGNHLDHLGDPVRLSRHQGLADDQAADEPAGRRKKEAQGDGQRLRRGDDVVGVHQEDREARRDGAEQDGAERAQEPDGRREKEELGVRVAPEESAEAGGPGRGRRLRRAHSSSTSEPAASSMSSSPPKKKLCPHAFVQKFEPPTRTLQVAQTALWQNPQRGRLKRKEVPQTPHLSERPGMSGV